MDHKFDKAFINGVITYKPPITEGLGSAIGKVSKGIDKFDAGIKRFAQNAKSGGDTALLKLFAKDTSFADELDDCRARGDKWFEYKGKKYPCTERNKDIAGSTKPNPPTPAQTASAAPIVPPAAPTAPAAPQQIKRPPARPPIKYPQP